MTPSGFDWDPLGEPDETAAATGCTGGNPGAPPTVDVSDLPRAPRPTPDDWDCALTRLWNGLGL
jgi:hypothetical protein